MKGAGDRSRDPGPPTPICDPRPTLRSAPSDRRPSLHAQVHERLCACGRLCARAQVERMLVHSRESARPPASTPNSQSKTLEILGPSRFPVSRGKTPLDGGRRSSRPGGSYRARRVRSSRVAVAVVVVVLLLLLIIIIILLILIIRRRQIKIRIIIRIQIMIIITIILIIVVVVVIIVVGLLGTSGGSCSAPSESESTQRQPVPS